MLENAKMHKLPDHVNNIISSLTRCCNKHYVDIFFYKDISIFLQTGCQEYLNSYKINAVISSTSDMKVSELYQCIISRIVISQEIENSSNYFEIVSEGITISVIIVDNFNPTTPNEESSISNLSIDLSFYSFSTNCIINAYSKDPKYIKNINDHWAFNDIFRLTYHWSNLDNINIDKKQLKDLKKSELSSFQEPLDGIWEEKIQSILLFSKPGKALSFLSELFLDGKVWVLQKLIEYLIYLNIGINENVTTESVFNAKNIKLIDDYSLFLLSKNTNPETSDQVQKRLSTTLKIFFNSTEINIPEFNTETFQSMETRGTCCLSSQNLVPIIGGFVRSACAFNVLIQDCFATNQTFIDEHNLLQNRVSLLNRREFWEAHPAFNHIDFRTPVNIPGGPFILAFDTMEFCLSGGDNCNGLPSSCNTGTLAVRFTGPNHLIVWGPPIKNMNQSCCLKGMPWGFDPITEQPLDEIMGPFYGDLELCAQAGVVVPPSGGGGETSIGRCCLGSMASGVLQFFGCGSDISQLDCDLPIFCENNGPCLKEHSSFTHISENDWQSIIITDREWCPNQVCPGPNPIHCNNPISSSSSSTSSSSSSSSDEQASSSSSQSSSSSSQSSSSSSGSSSSSSSQSSSSSSSSSQSSSSADLCTVCPNFDINVSWTPVFDLWQSTSGTLGSNGCTILRFNLTNAASFQLRFTLGCPASDTEVGAGASFAGTVELLEAAGPCTQLAINSNACNDGSNDQGAVTISRSSINTGFHYVVITETGGGAGGTFTLGYVMEGIA